MFSEIPNKKQGKEQWLQKIAALGVPRALLEKTDLTESDYSALHGQIAKISSRFFKRSLKITMTWQLYALLGRMQEAQNFLKDSPKDNWGMRLHHYAALSGNLEALDWAKKNVLWLLERKDNAGWTIAHHAALSGNPQTLAWVQENAPELLYDKDDYGNTIAHHAAKSANSQLATSVKNWLNKTSLYLILDNIGNQTKNLMVAAQGDSDSEFTTALTNFATYPLATRMRILNRQVRLDGKTILHLLCEKGHMQRLTEFTKHGGMLLASKLDTKNQLPKAYFNSEQKAQAYDELKQKHLPLAKLMTSFLAFPTECSSLEEKEEIVNRSVEIQNRIAALHESTALSEEIDKHIQEHVDEFGMAWQLYALLGRMQEAQNFLKDTPEDNWGMTLHHYAALFGNLEALDWAQKNVLGLLESKDNDGWTIAHYAARSGNPETLAWVQENAPGLLYHKDNYGNTIARHAAKSANSQLATSVKNWLNKTSLYLILDNIGNQTRNLMVAAQGDSDSEFTTALTNFATYPLATRMRILNRQIKLDGKTILHLLCEKGQMERLTEFAKYGGMLLASKRDKKKQLAQAYFNSEQKAQAYDELKQKHLPLAELMTSYLAFPTECSSLEEKKEIVNRSVEIQNRIAALHESTPLSGEIDKRIQEHVDEFGKEIAEDIQNGRYQNALEKLEGIDYFYPELISRLACQLASKPAAELLSKTALTLFDRLPKISPEDEQFIQQAINNCHASEKESPLFNKAILITTQQLMALIKQEIQDLQKSVNKQEVLALKIGFLNQLLNKLDDTPELALRVNSICNRLVTLYDNKPIVLLKHLVKDSDNINVIDLQKLIGQKDNLNLSAASTETECIVLLQKLMDEKAFTVEKTAIPPAMSDEEKEQWLQKIEALGVPIAMLEKTNITESDYPALHGQLDKISSSLFSEITMASQLHGQLDTISSPLFSNPWLKITMAWQLYALLGRMQEAKNSLKDSVAEDKNSLKDTVAKDNWGMTLHHYAALSSNLKALEWAQENVPGLLEDKDKFGNTIAHYAALSANLQVLDRVNKNARWLLLEKNNEGMSVFDFAARSGNLLVLEWVQDNTPILSDYYRYRIGSVANNAALSPNPLALAWVNNIAPGVLKSQDWDDNTNAHYAAWSGNLQTLAWVNNNAPGLLKSKNKHGMTIAHCTARSGNPQALAWVNNNIAPGLLKHKNIYGNTIAHFAARSGNPQTLAWVNNNAPGLLKSKNKYGETIAHKAARSGNRQVLAWVQENTPELLEDKNTYGQTIAFYAARSANYQLATTLKNWLDGTDSYLILDNIGNQTRNLMVAAQGDSDSEFTTALTNFATYPLATRMRILNRQIRLDGKTILHLLCEKSHAGRLNEFAKHGGMLLASKLDKKNQPPQSTLLQNYNELQQQYLPLTELLENYLLPSLANPQDTSLAALQRALNAKNSIQHMTDDVFVQEIKAQIAIDIEKLTVDIVSKPRKQILAYLAFIQNKEQREHYMSDNEALDRIFTHGTAEQKNTYCQHQNKQDLFEKMFLHQEKKNEYQLKPNKYSQSEILKQHCIFPYLVNHLNLLSNQKNQSNLEPHLRFFHRLILVDSVEELGQLLKTSNINRFFSSKQQSNNPFQFILSMNNQLKQLLELIKEFRIVYRNNCETHDNIALNKLIEPLLKMDKEKRITEKSSSTHSNKQVLDRMRELEKEKDTLFEKDTVFQL